MSLHLKSTFENHRILPILAQQFDDFLNKDEEIFHGNKEAYFANMPAESFQPVLQFSEHDLDNELDEVNYDIFEYSSTSIRINFRLFLSFENFAGHFRDKILELKKIDECNPVLRKPGRVLSPGPEAYKFIGWHNLDIDEKKKSYSTIFR